MAPLPQYLTGNQGKIRDFIGRFDVSRCDSFCVNPMRLASAADLSDGCASPNHLSIIEPKRSMHPRAEQGLGVLIRLRWYVGLQPFTCHSFVNPPILQSDQRFPRSRYAEGAARTGVLWSGEHLFEGTVETLDMLRSKGMGTPRVFVSRFPLVQLLKFDQGSKLYSSQTIVPNREPITRRSSRVWAFPPRL